MSSVSKKSLNIDDLLSQLKVVERQSPHSPLQIFQPNKDHKGFYYQLCQAYFDASPKQRAIVRDAVRRKAGVLNNLLGYIYFCADQVRETRSRDWLDIGLAAGSMRGDGPDFRDFLLALAELYVAAKDAGLDPSSAFKQIGGGVPANFETYAVLKSRLASDST